MKKKTKWFCPSCGAQVTKLPISNYKEDGKIWHIPFFGRAFCDKCPWKSSFGGIGLVRESDMVKRRENG